MPRIDFNARKGQITLFILVGIVLITVFVVMYNQRSREHYSPEADEAKSIVSGFVRDCLTQALEDSLDSIGQVGAIDLEPFILFEDSSVGVLFDGTTNLLPSLSAYGTEISQGAVLPFKACISDQGMLPYDVNIDDENLDFSVSFDDTTTRLEAIVPITITIGSSITKLSTFSTTAPVAFEKTYTLVSSYLSRLSRDPYLIPIDPLLFGDVKAAIYSLDETSLLIRIIDPESTVNGKAWSFQFDVQFPLGEYQ